MKNQQFLNNPRHIFQNPTHDNLKIDERCFHQHAIDDSLINSVIFNLYVAETGIFQESNTNTLAADALAPCITRSLAPMLLTMQDQWVLVFHEGGCQHRPDLKF